MFNCNERRPLGLNWVVLLITGQMPAARSIAFQIKIENQISPAMKNANNTAAEPMSLARPDKG